MLVPHSTRYADDVISLALFLLLLYIKICIYSLTRNRGKFSSNCLIQAYFILNVHYPLTSIPLFKFSFYLQSLRSFYYVLVFHASFGLTRFLTDLILVLYLLIIDADSSLLISISSPFFIGFVLTPNNLLKVFTWEFFFIPAVWGFFFVSSPLPQCKHSIVFAFFSIK